MARILAITHWILIIFPFILSGQQWSASKDSVQIGEPLTLTYRWNNGGQDADHCIVNLSKIANLLYKNDTLNYEQYADVEVDQPSLKNISLSDSLLMVKAQVSQADVSMRFYSIGDFEVGCGLDKVVIHVMMPVQMNQQATQDIKDIKPIIEVSGIDWIYWLFILMGIIIAAGIIYYIWKKWRTKPDPIQQVSSKVIIELLPEEEARLAFQELIDTQAYASADIKNFQSKVTDILKKYLHRQYQINAYEMTSNELAVACDQRNIAKRHLLSDILTIADQVKFAKARAGSDICREAIDKGLQFITSTHN